MPNAVLAKTWADTFRFGFLLGPAAGFHFMLILSRNISERNKKLIYLSYGIGILFTILGFFGLMTKEYIRVGVTYAPKPTLLYILSALNVAFWISYGLAHLVKTFKVTESFMVKNQLKYFFIGISLFVFFGFTLFALSLGFEIYPVSGFINIIWTGLIAYSILKYQAFDIRVVIKRAIVYTALTTIVAGIYTLIVAVSLAFGLEYLRFNSILVNTATAIIVAAGFVPVRNWLQNIVDKLFFKTKYDSQKILSAFSDKLSSLMVLGPLLDHIADTITNTLFVKKISILLINEENEKYTIRMSRNFNLLNSEEVCFEKGDYITSWFEKHKNKIFFNELNEIKGEFERKIFKLKSMLMVPVKLNKELIGIICVGEKMSEDAFLRQDLDFISSIASQSSVAIENARLTEQLRNFEKSMYQADKMVALGTLASTVVHEIKNPLVAIKTFTQLLTRKFEDKEYREKFSSIVPQELDHLETILNSLSDYSRLQKNQFERINVDYIIENILMLLSHEAAKKNIKVVKEYSRKDITIYADPAQIKQVLMNIILNAIQAIPGQGIISIMLEDSNKENLKIKVKDTGPGISKENIKQLFKPFFTTKTKGTGLGLSTSFRIIKEHGGNIEIESELKKGTTFIIELPYDG